MDNNINGDYAHLRVQQAQVQTSQESSKSDVQPREHSAQMHDDAAAEQLGRSQLLHINLPAAQEPVKLLGIKDILSNEHINDETADKILLEFGFSPEECTELRKKYPFINIVAESFDVVKNNATTSYGLEMSKEGILKALEYSLKNPKELEAVDYITQKNIDLLFEQYGLKKEDALDVLNSFSEDVSLADTALKITQLTDDSLETVYRTISYNNENSCYPNDKQLLAMKKLNDELGDEFSVYSADLLEHPEQVTPQFIEKLKKEIKLIHDNNIKFVTVKQDPVVLLDELKKINADIKKYGFDFSNITPMNMERYIDVINLPFAQASSDFIRQCADKVKISHSDVIMKMAKDKDFMENPKAMANLLNTIAKIPKNQSIYSDLSKWLKQDKNVDLEGITKVAQAFAEVGGCPKDTGAYALLAHDFTTNEPKYDDCVNFIHKLQEFYGGKDSKYSVDDYMSQVWRGIDYANYESCFDKLKEKGLYGQIHPQDLRRSLEYSQNPDILDAAIKQKNNPIVSGALYLFDEFSDEAINNEYKSVCESVKNLNPEYSDLDINDCVAILDCYTNLKPNFYNKLQFGYNIDDKILNINETLQKNKLFDCKEYAHKFFTTDFPNIDIKDKVRLFQGITEINKDAVFDILLKGNIPPQNLIEMMKQESTLWLALRDYKPAENIVENQKNIVLEHPDRYVNGENLTEEEMKITVNNFFHKNKNNLMVLSSATDKEAVNHLLRMRFDDAREYLGIIQEFGCADLDLLSGLNNSVNIDGKPFLPAQKIGFIDLLQAYKDNNLSTDKIKAMVDSGKVDFARLNIDLFNQIMKNAGLTEEEIVSIPKEKLTGWDTRYIHLLSKEIQEEKDEAFSDILRVGNLSDFRQYIQDTSNVYGQANAVTRKKFADLGMNYDKWLKPSQENEVVFKAKDDNKEQLSQIQKQFLEDIETLRQGPVKGFIDKQYAKYIKDNKFFIPQDCVSSKAKTKEFISGVIKALDPVWKRAQGNAQNPDPKRAAAAGNTLTILDHFNQRVKDIENVSDTGGAKNIDVKIKMWDRVPQKDIFQGNYSTCCIGMGGGNGTAMPYYLMNTAFNMIELVDNESGKTIGNALCFFEKDENGKPIFVIDNIEINNAQKPSDKVGLQLRDAITQYAANVAKEVTGRDNIRIVMGGQYNDVPCEDLPKRTQKIEFVGDISREDIYSDLYTDWPDKEDLLKPTKLQTWILK